MEQQTARTRTRQRIHKEPPPLDVPDINDDAVERKRVLNVLAQRRYRARKRQNRTAGDASLVSTRDSLLPPGQHPLQEAGNLQQGDEALPSVPDVTIVGDGIDLDLDLQFSSHLDQAVTAMDSEPGTGSGSMSLNNSSWMTAALDAVIGPSSSLAEVFLVQDIVDSNASSSVAGDRTTAASNSSGSNSPPTGIPDLPESIDPSLLFGASSSSISSSSSASTSTTDTFSFPDTYLLPVPELTLLRAFLRIAQRLGCSNTVWNAGALSPFYTPPQQQQQQSIPSSSSPSLPPADSSLLPKAWQPTRLQVVVPHHPMLDFLPWPAARDRAIQVFSLPDELRPAGAAGPMGLYSLVYDVEDAAEGMRIYGGDPYDPAGWEVGQVLFERWWFIFDREIVEQSNQWRSLRGAARLRLADSAGVGVETGAGADALA